MADDQLSKKDALEGSIQELSLEDSASSSSDTKPQTTNNDETRTYCHKVELPIFTGDRVEAWLRRAEQYFRLSPSTEQERLKSVKLYLDGAALDWFILAEDRSPFRSWQDFRTCLERRFRSHSADFYPYLLKLRQEASVSAFTAQFKLFASQLPDMADEVLASIYLNALKPAIKTEVKKARATHLHKIIEAALEAEANQYRNSPPRENVEAPNSKKESTRSKNMAYAYLGMAQGSPSDCTFKLWGSLFDRRVKILIASASHNFIREGLLKELNIPVEEIGPYEVDAVIGPRRRGSTMCRSVPLSMQGLSLKLNFLPYPLAFVDIVLGNEWLRQLGDILTSYECMQMKFMVGDTVHTIYGDPTI